MRKITLYLLLLQFFGSVNSKVLCQSMLTDQRIATIDKSYWNEVSRTVQQGDFGGYKASCHRQAILINTAGKSKKSTPMTTALARWKARFDNTKEGRQMDTVDFRFSERIGDETTAFEKGIFYFTSHDSSGNLKSETYIHIEAVLVKRNERWLCLVEHQKSIATKEEWDALKK